MGASYRTEGMDTVEDLKDRNLDKNGEYLNCTDCECRLKLDERWDDVCLDCKIKRDD